ncbi:hypothetical protein F2Q69_00014502 [Brassica cretica]|uniref:Uncharacterized protein n=1 Tax=Brassica cretica TaxID=69181 RepID=A0A8S9QMX6_BRACR|nr:hypothetical protein F2Q69_00014502 [Brassica cretica]
MVLPSHGEVFPAVQTIVLRNDRSKETRRLVYSPALIVDKPGDPALWILPYGLMEALSLMEAHSLMEACGLGSTGFYEHDVSRCFSEYEGTLRMSWRPWPEPVSRVVDVLQPIEEEGLLGVKFRLGGCGVDELCVDSFLQQTSQRVAGTRYRPEHVSGEHHPRFSGDRHIVKLDGASSTVDGYVKKPKLSQKPRLVYIWT